VAVGPTGLAFDPYGDVLYVASTADNKIFGIRDAANRAGSAGTGFVVFEDQTNLHGPLGLVLAPNGNLITANGDGVNAGGTQNLFVEFTKEGTLVSTYQLDGGALGAAFGIATSSSQEAVHFAAVDDDLNTVTVWTLRSPF
jgi:DNA-binding beta-propeller fold protein YncE